MKKSFTKLGIALMASASIFPLAACTFNFYINRATNSIAKSFADQTSALIKSMVMSKALNADTSSTNNDIMGQIKNGSINNLTGNTSLNTWGDLQSHWGDNGNIDVNGFDPNNYFKATGTGQLTKDVNSKKNINNVFVTIGYVRSITIIQNPQLANLILGPGMNPIITFLKSLQGDLSDSPASLQLVANLINNYGPNFLDPITSIFGNLVDGSWSNTQLTTPPDQTALQTFMNGWKDEEGQPYSAWSNGTTWAISPTLYPGHKVADWTSNKDYDLYHGGTLINYLFWKISKDHSIFGSKGTPRYLGDIVSDHVTVTGSIINPEIKFDEPAFLTDIQRYVPYLLTNPLYPLLIIEGIIPIIKKWILEMPDITQGVKHLTIGNGYPNNPSASSYNLVDTVNTIKTLINDPAKLKDVLKLVFGQTTAANRGFDTFIYDIKLKITAFVFPLTLTLGGVIGDGLFDPSDLINTIIGLLTGDGVKNIINSAVDLLTKISEQYPGNEGIDFDLKKIETFLLDNTIGLLIILNNDSIGVLKNIISKNDVTPTDVENLYKSLGGHIQPDPDFPIFTPGSIIDTLQKTMLQPNSELNNLLNLILGTIGTPHKLGIGDIITADNNKWIHDNYEVYFDANNTAGINKKIGNTYNISMNRNTKDNIETINLKYDFTYRIKDTTYHFVIIAIDVENLINFQGIRNFKFKSITLIN